MEIVKLTENDKLDSKVKIYFRCYNCSCEFSSTKENDHLIKDDYGYSVKCPVCGTYIISDKKVV